jgi:hypothetical protein
MDTTTLFALGWWCHMPQHTGPDGHHREAISENSESGIFSHSADL